MTNCLQCLGTGLASPTELCSVCAGSGQTVGEVSLTENTELLMQDENTQPVEEQAVEPQVETPVAPPQDNDHVAPGAEQFPEVTAEEVAPAAE